MMARRDLYIPLEIPFTCKMAAVVCSRHAPPLTLSPVSSLILCLSASASFSLSLSLTHTHTHTLSLSESLFGRSVVPLLPFDGLALSKRRRDETRRDETRFVATPVSVKRPNSLRRHAHYTGSCFSRNESGRKYVARWKYPPVLSSTSATTASTTTTIRQTYLPGLWKINARGYAPEY